MSDELTELPEGWCHAFLSELGNLSRGKSKHRPRNDPKLYGEFVPFIQTGEVARSKGRISSFSKMYSEFGVQQSRIFPKGTVCITIAANIADTGILEFDACFPDSVVGLITDANLADPYFVEYFLRTIREDLAQFAPATAQANINLEILNKVSVPLPPLNEQKRIVAKIEELNDRHQRAKQALEAIPELCDRFRQSVLAAAFRGDLTADWREENPDVEPASELLERIAKNRRNRYTEACAQAKQQGKSKPRKVLPDEIPQLDCKVELPETWIVTNIEFLAHVTKLAGFEYTKYITLEDAGDVPVVRAQNVQMGKFVKENIKYISQQTSDFLERSQLHGREILMVFIGAGTGNVCLAPSGRWHLAPNVAKLDVDGIDIEYLLTYLQSPVGRNNVLVWAKATAQASLSMETIRQIQVHIPPLEEQKEVVVRLKKLLSFIDTVEQQYGNMKLQFDRLNQSILAKAFRGELVEQDPNDEPASVLLDRIRAEREKLQGNKKSGSVRGKRKKATDNQLDLPGLN